MTHNFLYVADCRRRRAAGEDFQGYWSRRITDEQRLVCKIVEDEIRVAACRYHYER